MTEIFTSDDVARLRTVFLKMARQLDRQVDNAGLTRSQLSVLGSTARLGPIVLGELAEVEGLNPTMLSRIVGKLAQAGLIDRMPDPADRRVVRIAVTPAGRRQHDTLRAQRSRLLAGKIAQLPASSARQLLELLPALELLVGPGTPTAGPDVDVLARSGA